MRRFGGEQKEAENLLAELGVRAAQQHGLDRPSCRQTEKTPLRDSLKAMGKSCGKDVP